ncbi:transglycosylase family protein [Streptomyces sp. NPDC048566]|uniref:transglycosylase family protein n=1 Tax=Streptomyces sp. NPDC048566 TaxID=3365569 RepID=UPI0037131F3E
MLSGNGRHRRPRQAPALIVAAGVTGSAIAIPLLGASSASAADGTTWDRVAECESGGAWSADNGNGYYGGLQLSQENWEAYGGRVYAPTPDQASRSQQIAVAEKVLDGQGLAAWPTCGPLSGLSKSSAGVEVDTGMGDGASGDGESDATGLSTSPDSSPSRGSSRSSDTSSSAETGSPEVTENTTKSDTSRKTEEPGGGATGDETPDETGTADKSGRSGDASEPSASASTAPGRHRGGSADEDAADADAGARADAAGGRHASRGVDEARDADGGTYVVRAGDSLSTIADTLDLAGGWSGLYAANERTVGADPDLILPGQSLALDAETVEK